MTIGVPCANCGASTTPKGRHSARRYCMSPECQNAKQRWNYAQRHAIPPRMESRPCSSCGAPLPERPWRASDVAYGRWCRKATCQRHRVMAATEYREALEIWDQLEPVNCDACGLWGARKGYLHRRLDNTDFCYTTGEAELVGMLASVALEAWRPQMRRAKEEAARRAWGDTV